MKTQRKSPLLALRLSAMDATHVGLVFKLKTALKLSVVQSRFRKSTTLLIVQVA